MAARGLGQGALPCVVLIPSPHFEAWVSALTDTAAGGWTLVPWTGGALPAPAPKTALLVADPALAPDQEPESWTVIATGLRGASKAAADRYGLPAEQGVWVASRLLAAACGLPDARWITDAELTGEPVEILPGWRVTPPKTRRSEHETAAAQALALYAAGAPPVGARVEWPPELFSYDRRRPAPGPAPGGLDVTGGPRILVFGPYVSLPAGLWRATLAFTVDEAAAGLRYRVEWGDQAAFAFHPFRPERAGRYELQIEHRWPAPAAAEVRLVLEEGAIDGLLTFEGLELERLA